jgi:Ca-activated chloride channel family protein
MKRTTAFGSLALAAAGVYFLVPVSAARAAATSSGALVSIDRSGKPRGACPLKHTDVEAEISGFIARVTVTQEFENPFSDKVEAIYTFPLPAAAAVDDMTMLVGERKIRGTIKRREEARAVYEAARRRGHVASLLDQERPNIFTQAVANIMPGEKVKITISYVEMLKFEDGAYEFGFPMVVGPRYTPKGTDASKITPPVTPPATRAGHDIDVVVKLDAGVPIDSLKSITHEIDMERPSVHEATIRLRDRKTIPNKDFLLKYDVLGERISDAVLTHKSGKNGYFSLILQPPERVTPAEATPKELVFVLDTSGSMEGFPIEKAKETMKLALSAMNPQDTFNLITFAGDTQLLFPEPVPATPENLQRAQAFLAGRRGSGGTEMMQAIRAALDPSGSQKHVRIVCFMTDGYVGNDMAIISEVQKHSNARVFSFGIGNSVNRFLLDKIAEEGRGDVEYVGLKDDGSAAARRFHERVRNPLLTDISLHTGQLPVADVYPKRIPDLFGAKPIVVTGRYTGAARGTIHLTGKLGGRGFSREIAVNLPENEPGHDVLASLWARARIDDLMAQDYAGIQNGNPKPEVREAITQLGLEHRLMTQFTSFVAVEEMRVTEGGQPRTVEVPVEMPEGVSYEGVFGDASGPVAVQMSPIGFSPAFLRSRATLSTQQATIYVPKTHSSDRSEIATPAASLRRQASTKLHPELVQLIERVKTTGAAGANRAAFVKDGKAELQVWLSDTSPAAIAQLKGLGFEVTLEPKSAKMVIGRIKVGQIEALSKLEIVRYAAPASLK